MAVRIVVDAELEAVVAAYGAYQLRERRLAPTTVASSAYRVRAFLAWRTRAAGSDLASLAPGELGEFIVEECARLKATSAAGVVTTLRGLCRFLYATGVTERDLSAAVPSVPSSRFGRLPKGVDTETVGRLLAACDRSRPTGRRDYAVLMLMWRLGLRAIEVSRLRLDDLLWRAGEVAVSAKAGRVDRMPLPADVGDALVDYLRFGRPASEDRAVFLRALPPPVGMSRNAVVFVSRTASARAGLAVVGGHRLRHTTAMDLLGAGASLREIGQVLRHDEPTTTAIYAKVDQAGLAGVARPWPEELAR